MKKVIIIIPAFLILFLAIGRPVSSQINLEQELERGKALYEAGDYEEGIIFLKKLTERYPNSADAWFWLGMCYERLGYFDAAQECYKRTLSIEPKYEALSKRLNKIEREIESPPPESPPRLLKEARKLAIISTPKDERLEGRVEPFAEAIAREIRSRLLRYEGIEVLANQLYENNIKKLSEDADLLIFVSFSSSREKVGLKDADFAVNIKVVDPLSKTIKWEQNIWMEDMVKEVYRAVRSKRLGTLLFYTEIPILISGEAEIITVGTVINFMTWILNETIPDLLPIGNLTQTELLTAFAALTKKVADRIFQYWNLAPTIHPSKLEKEKLEEEKRKLEWLKRGGLVAQIAWIDDKGKVIINAGVEKGVEKGDKFLIFRKGRPIIDPTKQEVIGYDEIVIGYIEIEMVREKISFGKVTKWIRKDIAVGDWIRKITD
ncbi:MAG: tetratricopeptide repeat protein [Synergistetes bacterium]|nr:tetratricopeptide repeat protein [Synergistota bacterium]MCX8128348.1 tetratricopeptide repeat protein [Synergistota bacterium]MDW8192994.1 tetratricopeptide repeat protein [Synergistota bacterium]